MLHQPERSVDQESARPPFHLLLLAFNLPQSRYWLLLDGDRLLRDSTRLLFSGYTTG